jgi:hypothetical protein
MSLRQCLTLVQKLEILGNKDKRQNLEAVYFDYSKVIIIEIIFF